MTMIARFYVNLQTFAKTQLYLIFRRIKARVVLNVLLFSLDLGNCTLISVSESLCP